MATLVLTAVGSAIGGPIGGAIGSLIGQTVDRNLLFRPARREGPRLTDLAVQTSSYGAAIPRIYGTLRVAGTVIWSTDLIESRSTSSNGKGQPKTTSYSYSASFAVLLSARAIRSVGRIWADGKLLRGSGGDFKSTVAGFRVWTGAPEQAADPLIASAEGMAQTPAYRGMAYAVFEGLQLADFGNRIPSLTFEVSADNGGTTLAAILSDVTGGTLVSETGGDASAMLGGYSAYGRRQSAVASDLADIGGLWFAPGDVGVTVRGGSGASMTIRDEGVRTPGERRAPSARSIEAPDRAPYALSLSYYDPARDYQAGLQRAWRAGAGIITEQLDLAAAIDADRAEALATGLLARRDLERQTRTIAADWSALSLCPGDRVTIEGEGGTWRVTNWSFEGMRVTLDLKPVAPAGQAAAGAESGRALSEPDVTIGPTQLAVFEVPALNDTLLNRPRILIAANGAMPGWRSAVLSYRDPSGSGAQAAGTVNIGSTMGEVVSPPGSADAMLVDRRNVIEVTLLNPEMQLNDADDATLDGGANAAWVGGELIQFASAQPLGGGRWRLTGLWRGRRGTEWAMGGHAVGERFVQLDPGAQLAVDIPLSTLGTTIAFEALGVGDVDGPASAQLVVSGDSLVPPTPVHFSATWPASDSLQLSWVRRSRAGWNWTDGGDVPLSEEREAYRVTLSDQSGWSFSADTTQPNFMMVFDHEPVWPLSVSVCQLGTFGPSRVLSGTIPTLQGELA